MPSTRAATSSLDEDPVSGGVLSGGASSWAATRSGTKKSRARTARAAAKRGRRKTGNRGTGPPGPGWRRRRGAARGTTRRPWRQRVAIGCRACYGPVSTAAGDPRRGPQMRKPRKSQDLAGSHWSQRSASAAVARAGSSRGGPRGIPRRRRREDEDPRRRRLAGRKGRDLGVADRRNALQVGRDRVRLLVGEVGEAGPGHGRQDGRAVGPLAGADRGDDLLLVPRADAGL